TVAAENEFIGKFKLLRKLGEGGMGSVYLAQDQRVKPPRMVAIKMLRDNNAELRERFGREVGIIANFEHPNIVHVFEVDEHEGHPFMAMAYVKGETLLEIIKRKAPLPLVRKLLIIEHLCAGLAYAHRQGVVHRDIKPGNVMVDAEETLKILDFGIARLADSTLTVSGSIIGTPNYMSPEQVNGQPIGPQSDIFAVGALAYEILAYQQAFPGKVPEVLGRILYSEPVPLRQTQAALDGPIADIIDRALKKEPAERYQDLADMQRDVAKVRKRLEETSDDRTIVDMPRRAEIEPLLTAARDALTAGDFAAARARAAQVLEIDTRNTDALAIDQSAHLAMVDRQNREWLEKAREFLAVENVTGADEMLQQVVRQSPNLPEASKLRAEIAQRRQRQEEEVAHKRAVARGLARARTNIAEGAFEAASRALDEVFALVPNHPDALTLSEEAKAGVAGRDSATQDQPSPQAITEARQQAIADCLDAGLKAVAAGRVDQAAQELAEIRRIDPQAAAGAQLSQKIDAERAAIARRHHVETIRMDVQKAIEARNMDLAERLTKELAESGADTREIQELRTRILTVRHGATAVVPPPFTPRPAAPPAAPSTERKPVTEADRMSRAGLRAFYHAEYDKALEAFRRIPKSASGGLPRERVLLYMACSTAAMALLEGEKGRTRLQQARELFQQAQPDKNPFALDRKYISPEIIGALEGKPLAHKA
ncbi:MAG TPA: protein kinase, partial [Vicinamibacterales bacterium]|nr:protein kinase [Vicinamibacterales bacterium]